MITLNLILLVVVAAYRRQFLALVFDEEFARLRGVPVGFFYLLLLVRVAVTIVLLIQAVGLIVPAAVAGHYVNSLGRMMLVATLLGAVLSLAGLALSYGPDLPAGPTIILLVGGVYVLSAILAQVLDRRRARLAAVQGTQQEGTDAQRRAYPCAGASRGPVSGAWGATDRSTPDRLSIIV